MSRYLNRVMEIRHLTGMSQAELAAMLNTSRSSIAMNEATGRLLPGDAGLYEACIFAEMRKPENQQAIAPETFSARAGQKWKKELLDLAAQRRYEAELLKRKMDLHAKKQASRHNRLVLIHCVEKAQAFLRAQSNGTAWKPITERQIKWLETVKTFNSWTQFDEAAYLQHRRNQLRYTMLLQEAEEAEKLAAEEMDGL